MLQMKARVFIFIASLFRSYLILYILKKMVYTIIL